MLSYILFEMIVCNACFFEMQPPVVFFSHRKDELLKVIDSKKTGIKDPGFSFSEVFSFSKRSRSLK